MSESAEGPPGGTPNTPLGIPTGFGPSGRAGAPPVQRVRVTFTKEAPLRYIGHLDLVRAWERAFRRARLPLAYTLGFTPHPRLAFAAPLSLGATSGGELADIYLRERVEVDDLASRIAAQLPAGCAVVRAADVPMEAPSLNALTRWAEYIVEASASPDSESGSVVAAQGSRWARPASVQPDALDESELPWRTPQERLGPLDADPALPPAAELSERIATLLLARSLPRERVRDGKAVSYDLRPLVLALSRRGPNVDGKRVSLSLVVRLDAGGAGRPDEICAALGLRARLVHRVSIGLEGDPPPAFTARGS